ncbi:hypothetical protein ABT160_41950 [Streptomyces sp. NPDC001941]|uniref:hypothetical protein n=1 Tax=Streptomyces sp. NPDC001941 TaxID=3154659 RepID=UPI00331AD84E
MAQRDVLADEVVHALRMAGLPAHRCGVRSHECPPGAGVEVSPEEDLYVAAVMVSWGSDESVYEAALTAKAAGDHYGPAVRRGGITGLHMQPALVRILLSAGILATLNNDTDVQDLVLVFGRMSDLPPALRVAVHQ